MGYLKSLSVQFGIFILAGIIYDSEQYNMSNVVRSPNATTTPSPQKVREEVLEFESRRSVTFSTVTAKMSLVDATQLCEIVAGDIDMLKGLQGKRMFHFVPVYPANGYNLPTFTEPCFGWTRKRCAGTPKPPFDYRCHFWLPHYYFAGDGLCVGDEMNGGRRKKRMTEDLDPIVLNGLEAATLCATSGQTANTRTFSMDAIALPTNEGSRIRCINWSLSFEGGWKKDKLSAEACRMLNHGRPSGYILSEVNDGVIDDLFPDLVRCESRDKVVECTFPRNNMREGD